MTDRSNITRALLLPPLVVAVISLLLTLPWTLAQPAAAGAHYNGWLIGSIALIAYPLAIIANFLITAWLVRRARSRGIEMTQTLRRLLLLIMPALLIVFIAAMAIAIPLRHS